MIEKSSRTQFKIAYTRRDNLYCAVVNRAKATSKTSVGF
jgi:hypothetical protein